VQRLKHGREASVSRPKFECGLVLGLALLLASAWSCSRADPRASTAGPADVPHDGAKVVILPREVDELDPRYVGDAYGLKLSRLLYASLTTIDPFSLAPRMDLAESVERESELRYRVRIRPGLAFADGSALDADDVVATFRAIADPRVKSRYRSSYARLRKVWREDVHTVLFELSEPHATFVTDLELPVLRSEDAFAARSAERLPVASGPYRLESRSRAVLALGPNPHYASASGRAPRHPRLRFVVVRDDNVRALRMLAGAGDLAQSVLPSLLLPLFERHPSLQLRTALGAGTTYLAINLEDRDLRDLRLRRAMAHAIDRVQLIRHKLGGRASLASSWLPEGHWAYAADTPAYGFDPARARTLLREAGRSALGPITLRTSSDRSVVSLARAIAAMLAEVGIELEVRPSESASLLSDLARGRFRLALMQVPEVFEPNVLTWFFASDHVPEPGVREGGNRFRLRSPELDRALEQGRLTTDLEARKVAYRSAQHLLARELPMIPLWHEHVVAVVSKRLSDYRVPRDARFGSLAR
jgi:peptide/nickel transport system substrate-binding protein